MNYVFVLSTQKMNLSKGFKEVAVLSSFLGINVG